MHVPLNYYLILSATLFSIGMFSIISKNNVFSMIIGIELILNSAILNFLAFWRFNPLYETQNDMVSGMLIGIFIMVLATCELAVILSILLNVYSKTNTTRPDFVDKMKN